MAVWDAFLTEDDIKVMAARKPRQPHGPGNKVALLLIDMQNTAMGHNKPIYEQLDEFSGACGPHAWKSVPYQQKLLAAARAAGVPVIYSKHVFHAYTGLPASNASNNFSSVNAKSDIPVEVAMQEGEYLIEKRLMRQEGPRARPRRRGLPKMRDSAMRSRQYPGPGVRGTGTEPSG